MHAVLGGILVRRVRTIRRTLTKAPQVAVVFGVLFLAAPVHIRGPTEARDHLPARVVARGWLPVKPLVAAERRSNGERGHAGIVGGAAFVSPGDVEGIRQPPDACVRRVARGARE